YYYDGDNDYDTPQKLPENFLKHEIPSAEHYPYVRSVFYNDGTGRVKEQGAAGNDFRYDPSDPNSRTIKTFYTKPSEIELTSIFGSEAPYSSRVSKSIVFDNNNIGSISYIDYNGKVIATAI